jgi:hypothetical protein
MADAYVINLTTGAVTKNGTALTNVIDMNLALRWDDTPGPIEGDTVPALGFRITARIADAAADARILAQGPSGLLGSNVAFFAGKPAEYVLRSKVGDTLAFTNTPGAPITAAPLENASVDGFQP